jgi:hypothetical protein
MNVQLIMHHALIHTFLEINIKWVWWRQMTRAKMSGMASMVKIHSNMMIFWINENSGQFEFKCLFSWSKRTMERMVKWILEETESTCQNGMLFVRSDKVVTSNNEQQQLKQGSYLRTQIYSRQRYLPLCKTSVTSYTVMMLYNELKINRVLHRAFLPQLRIASSSCVTSHEGLYSSRHQIACFKDIAK